MTLLHITDTSFKNDVIDATKPVLIDFWAEWCGPCRMLGPILEELSQDLGDSVVVGKMNIDENPDTPGALGVSSIPTLMLFKGGKMVGTKVGVHSKTALQEWISSL